MLKMKPKNATLRALFSASSSDQPGQPQNPKRMQHDGYRHKKRLPVSHGRSTLKGTETAGRPPQLAFLPDKIPYVKPRLKVAEGDHVSIGSVLFEDKQTPAIQFLSPAGGVVSKIQYGPRRVLEKIIIDRDLDKEDHIPYPGFQWRS
jgi:hypothetical protein